jgi:hypothetical protein
MIQPAQPGEAALTYLIRWRLTLVLSSKRLRVAPGQDYLPAELTVADGAGDGQAVVEVFRWALNRAITWVNARAQQFGDQAQNGDLRRYMLFIFLAILGLMGLFLLVNMLGLLSWNGTSS